MKWLPIRIALPKVFGWADLPFGDRLKLMGFLAQFGAGVAMTFTAGFAMLSLARMEAVWPVFYLGFGALVLVGIIVTGFASLLIVRTLEVRGPGGFVFKSQDAQGADAAIAGLTETVKAMPAEPVISDEGE